MRLTSLLMTATSVSVLSLTGARAAEINPHEVSEVVVTAAPYAVSVNSATTSIDVISREQLDTLPPAGLGDVLNGMPGLRSTFFGPGASRPVIRGLSGPRVLILQNGVGLVDASSLSPDHAVASDPGEASRIEVLRGPSTLAYGGSGIGGVVNVLDERVPTSRATNLEGRLSATYNTADQGQSISGGTKFGFGPIVFATDGVHRTSENYDVPSNPVSNRRARQDGVLAAPDRQVKNAAVTMDAYGAGVSYVAEDGGFVGLSAKQTNSTYGVPYAQLVEAGNGQDQVQIELKQTRWDLRGAKDVDFGPFEKIKGSVGYADYQHREIEVATGAVGTRFLSNGAEGRLDLVQKAPGDHKGAVGLQVLSRSLEALGAEAFIPSVDIREEGIFTLQRWDFDTWGLDTGLRLDHHTVSAKLAGRPSSAAAKAAGINWATTPHQQDFTNISASAGLFWKPMDHVFYALSLSQNGRAPTESELYADGPHGGTSSYELGNPHFSSETVTSLEATFRYTPDKGRAEVHVYSAVYDGYIEESPTGQTEAGLPVFRYTQTGATFYGMEFEGHRDLWQTDQGLLILSASADYVHGETDLGIPARIPSYAVTSALAWEGDSFNGKIEVRHVGKQDRVADYELPTDSYTLLNATLSWKPVSHSKFKLFADAHNLTNATAREHTSFLKDVAPLPGRSLRVGAAYSF